MQAPKRPSARACNLTTAQSFMDYLELLRHEDRLPSYAYGGIPITFNEEGTIFSPHYDVYISLGNQEFIYYKQVSEGKFQRFKNAGGVSIGE